MAGVSGPDYNGPGDSYVYIETSTHYLNEIFCVGQPTTHTYYPNNWMTGWPNGLPGYSVSTSVSGGCSGWLSNEIILYD